MGAQIEQTKCLLASAWIDALDAHDATLARALAGCYGSDALATDRIPLLRRVLATFLARFGDATVRIVRCPGRINLRGMHVDTHGGYLNLMTHHREVVVVSGVSSDIQSTVVNVDNAFPDIQFDPRRWCEHDAFRSTWSRFINHDEVKQHVASRRGSWANYIDGSVLRAQHEWPSAPLYGIHAAVGSDIPRGASLSSSTALSLAVFMSVSAWNGNFLSPGALIPIAQDIEWFTGARIGTSDQSGMLFPGANELINFAPGADSTEFANLRRVPFPVDLSVLVINSHTERSISGAQQINYTRNRFAYSLALDILHQEMTKSGVPIDRREHYTRLSDFAMPNLDPLGGVRALYGWLARVPQTLTLDEMRARYTLPLLEETYDRYFGPLPEKERPQSFTIRGPLIFGLAESERARLFVDALTQGDHEVTGYYMTLGHDGDRQFDAMGLPWACDVDDDQIRNLTARETHIARVPGAYGASSRALDALVDCAVSAGALGASLTGAGIAGVVIALTEAPYAERVADGIRRYVASEEYRAIAPRVGEISERDLKDSVVINSAPGPAGEIRFG